MQTAEGNRARPGAQAMKNYSHSAELVTKTRPEQRLVSSAPGMKQLPVVDDVRRVSSAVQNGVSSQVVDRSPVRSRISLTRDPRSTLRSSAQPSRANADSDKLDSARAQGQVASSGGAARQAELPGSTGARAGVLQKSAEDAEKSVFAVAPLPSGGGHPPARKPFEHEVPSATTPARPSAAPLTASGGDGAAATRRNAGESERSLPTLRQQIRRISDGTDGLRRRSREASPAAPGISRSVPVLSVEAGSTDEKRGRLSGSGQTGEARVPGMRSDAATRPVRVLETSGIGGDAITIETRDSFSRGRHSPRMLREMLGAGDKGPASPSARRAAGGGASAVAAVSPNPLHHRTSVLGDASASTSDSDTPYRSSYAHGNGTTDTQSGATPAELRVHNAESVSGDDGGEHDVGVIESGHSFASYRGGLEWLRVPSLFFLFASIIKWNELRLQRRTIQLSLEDHRTRGGEASLSLLSVWTQHRERELLALESHISFSVFELQGIYLNLLLVQWSKPKLRALVVDVAETWDKQGPYSDAFDAVSSRLFDAISTEQTCQLHSTFLFVLRQWLGGAQHRWHVAAILAACFVVAVLCIVFLAVFGRSQVVVCIVLSAVLGAVVVLMYVVSMFVLHHNTYAEAAARYLRQEAVRVAQQKMEEEEMAEDEEAVGDAGLVWMHGMHGVGKASRDAVSGGGRAGTSLSHGADEESVAMAAEDEMSLAVRNLRALTEGGRHPATVAPSYYRLPGAERGGKRGAGGYEEDEVTLTDERYASLTSRPLNAKDAVRQQLDRENTLLLSRVTFEQHQAHMDQHKSHIVQERLSTPQAPRPIQPRLSDNADDPAATRTQRDTLDSWGSDADEAVQPQNRQQAQLVGHPPPLQLADLPEEVNVTALLYCRAAPVLAQVAPPLWDRSFMVLRVNDLKALDKAFRHGSERFKVILIHAPDAPAGSAALETALSWLQVDRRPVFFFCRVPATYPVSVPPSARLQVPFSAAALNTLLLAGIGVEAELGSTSFPAMLHHEPQQPGQQYSSAQPFQVPPYTLGRRLGGGAFGNVFEAEMESTGGKCAVKRMYLKEEDSDKDAEEQPHGGGTSQSVSGEGGGGATTAAAVGSQLREIAQEVEIMSSLQHPNIVRYYFCERDDNCISIFMELCTGGSLSSLIHSGKLVNPPEIKLILREIISAVAYLHNMRIVHRDLKPDNVLFRQGHAKITDFGTAVHKHGGDLRLIKGTFAYMAPEILVGDPYGRACDVWSIGCIAAEVLSVELPQHALGLPEMCEYYRAMGEDSELPIECNVSGVRDFLLGCLQRNPNERGTAADLFYHPILQPGDTSIHTWMVTVVARRRRSQIQQQQQAFHRNGGWGGGGGGPFGGTQVSGTSGHTSSTGGIGDGFDLQSDDGSAVSLDSSRLVNTTADAGEEI